MKMLREVAGVFICQSTTAVMPTLRLSKQDRGKGMTAVFGYEMKEISLTQGYVAIVDDEDSDLANLKWYVRKGYAIRTTGVLKKGTKKRHNLHRVILERILNRPLRRDEDTDHRDNNKLNNRRSNLRVATRSQNEANQGKQINNKSGYKGVSQFGKKKWRSAIVINRKQIHLGLYNDRTEAARAYDKKAIEIFGEFAYLNFPNENS